MEKISSKDKVNQQIVDLNIAVDDYFEEKSNTKFGVLGREEIVNIEEKIEDIALKIREKINEDFQENGNTFGLVNLLGWDNLSSKKKYAIRKNGDVIQMKLPPLLHKKVMKKKKNIVGYAEDYDTFRMIDINLYQLLLQFKKQNLVGKYDSKVLIYVKNIVKNGTKLNQIPDTDNHEYYDLINTISSAFLYDDNHEYVAHLHDTEYGDDNKTEVYLIPFNEIKTALDEVLAISYRSTFKVLSNDKNVA